MAQMRAVDEEIIGVSDSMERVKKMIQSLVDYIESIQARPVNEQ